MFNRQTIREQLAGDYSPESIEIILESFPRGGTEHIDFSGQNCEPIDGFECEGWDGLSRRCQCGNRRVYWVVEDGFAYGVAD